MKRAAYELVQTLVLVAAMAISARAETVSSPIPDLQLSPLSLGGGSITLRLEQQCMLGDFDAIRHDMMYAGIPRLLVSVEAIDTGAEVTATVYNELDDLPEPSNDRERSEQEHRVQAYLEKILGVGEKVTLSLPATNSGYIVRVCKDSQRSESCTKKPVVDISQLLKKLAQVESSYVSPDVVYYYQPVFKGKGSFESLDRSVVEGDHARLKGMVEGASQSLTSGLVEGVVNAILTARSWPLSSNGDSLVITFPVYSKSKCSGQKEEK